MTFEANENPKNILSALSPEHNQVDEDGLVVQIVQVDLPQFQPSNVLESSAVVEA